MVYFENNKYYSAVRNDLKRGVSVNKHTNTFFQWQCEEPFDDGSKIEYFDLPLVAQSIIDKYAPPDIY